MGLIQGLTQGGGQQPQIPQIPQLPQQPEIPQLPQQPEIPQIPQQPQIPEIPTNPQDGGGDDNQDDEGSDISNCSCIMGTLTCMVGGEQQSFPGTSCEVGQPVNQNASGLFQRHKKRKASSNRF